MTWAKIDDRLHSHPKARRAGLEAMGLWALCLSFCGAYSTDGAIGRADVEAIGGKRALLLAAKLVEAGLWIGVDGGWSFHDFLSYNPSAAQVEAERKRKAEAGRRGGLAKAAAASISHSSSLAAASPLLPEPAVLPIPSRPDPGSGSADPSTARSNAGARAGGLPAGSGPDPDLIALAQVLAAEGKGIGESVCELVAQGRMPTPGQLATLRKIRDERVKQGEPQAVQAPASGSANGTSKPSRGLSRRDVEAMLDAADHDTSTMSPSSEAIPPAPQRLRPAPRVTMVGEMGEPLPSIPQAALSRVDLAAMLRGGR